MWLMRWPTRHGPAAGRGQVQRGTPQQEPERNSSTGTGCRIAEPGLQLVAQMSLWRTNAMALRAPFDPGVDPQPEPDEQSVRPMPPDRKMKYSAIFSAFAA